MTKKNNIKLYDINKVGSCQNQLSTLSRQTNWTASRYRHDILKQGKVLKSLNEKQSPVQYKKEFERLTQMIIVSRSYLIAIDGAKIQRRTLLKVDFLNTRAGDLTENYLAKLRDYEEKAEEIFDQLFDDAKRGSDIKKRAFYATDSLIREFLRIRPDYFLLSEITESYTVHGVDSIDVALYETTGTSYSTSEDKVEYYSLTDEIISELQRYFRTKTTYESCMKWEMSEPKILNPIEKDLKLQRKERAKRNQKRLAHASYLLMLSATVLAVVYPFL